MDPEKALKKEKKRMTLGLNKFKGKFTEQSYVTSAILQGKKVTRKAHGSDYIEQKLDLWGNPKGKKIYVEVKSSSTAKLSTLQKKTKAKKKGSYKVWRPSF